MSLGIRIAGRLAANGASSYLRHTADGVQIVMPSGVIVIVTSCSDWLLRDMAQGMTALAVGPVATTPLFPYEIERIEEIGKPAACDIPRYCDQMPPPAGCMIIETPCWADYLSVKLVQAIGILSDGRVVIACPLHSYIIAGDASFASRIHDITTGGKAPDHVTTLGPLDYWYGVFDRLHATSIEVRRHGFGGGCEGLRQILADFRANPEHVAVAEAVRIASPTRSRPSTAHER